ncbi:hypothetical protein AB1Y20_022481 [Prymnesium parvum]|uniref:Uncharacterized protein n=1 Tax=Prymnesium parvum TaxID=97485 RepID=A0AB34JJN7_PRYPA|mmetsp:Transcript_30892/g.75092  ORF Transcript_30892/g.75092 Transcript_30892/m.75092 type:complete len:97 (-) Transcript_30892:184-474(-)|eukprot:CAMPEP_0182814564 /NCGR_PEP_ID=MMETSP0006_2-20121128/9924_1 /TAXON_ID=97485 /ORGANISM="Prymnesium parvum, Strain Texoma1" /LENGTH=96 /DNA_ID=CAMNT_0024940703 /DNA_START=18 /DNA_END=308 /DNA_ORIENTATION=-
MAEELAQGMAAAAVSNWEPMEFNDARKASVKAAFELAASEGKLSMKEVHKLLFTAEERSEYNFDNFQEDLFSTQPKKKEEDTMCWEEVLKFLDDNL